MYKQKVFIQKQNLFKAENLMPNTVGYNSLKLLRCLEKHKELYISKLARILRWNFARCHRYIKGLEKDYLKNRIEGRNKIYSLDKEKIKKL